MENVIAVLIFVGALVLAGLLWAWSAYRRRHAAPVGWTHVGAPPPGTTRALEVLSWRCFGMRWGGVIEWVDAPWHVGYGPASDGMLAAGQVLDYDAHRIRLLRFPEVWRTALAHELHHLWRYDVADDQDEPENEAFRRWVHDANSQIAAAVAKG